MSLCCDMLATDSSAVTGPRRRQSTAATRMHAFSIVYLTSANETAHRRPRKILPKAVPRVPPAGSGHARGHPRCCNCLLRQFRTGSLLASPIQDPGGESSDKNAATCQTAHHEPHGRRRRLRRVLCQAESAGLTITSSSCGIGTACGPHRRGCLATPSTALAA